MIPYLRELLKGGHEISLLTFEPGKVDEELVRKSLSELGIEWHWLRYHKTPSVPATLYDLANGVRLTISLARKKKIDIFHVRGHIPAPIGAIAKNICGGKLLFDIRGFLPEEYVDAGVWDEKGVIYKTFKRVERWIMKRSDGFVVLTERARDILFPEARESGLDKKDRPVEVIPCCVDLLRFTTVESQTRKAKREELGTNNRWVIAYVGSFGGWYLTDEMFDLLEVIRRGTPDMFAMILTQREQEMVRSELENRGFRPEEFVVMGVPYDQIGSYLSVADASLSFIKASYSKQSSSPTKLAEYLAAGLPVISNRGVGDVDQLLETNGVGFLVDDFSDESYSKAVVQIKALGNVRDKCREVALREFDLETVGGPRYRRLYERLMDDK